MKKKIINIFVCLTLISTIAIPVASVSDTQVIRSTSYVADVPTWEEGDEWTYHFTESATVDPVYSLSGDITLKVVDDSGDSYILEASTHPIGKIDMGIIGLKATRFTTFTMRLQMRKADLALEKFREIYKGFLLLTI